MTTGTGFHPSSGVAALAVKDAIHAAAAAALTAAAETEVDLCYGFRWPPSFPDEVAITAVRVAPQEGTVSPQQRRRMDVFVDVNIVSFRVTDDEQVTHTRAFGLLGLIDEHVRETDRTLGGAALWCVLDEVQSDGATAEEDAGSGRLTEIAATFMAAVYITR